jgi:hypothetical protein
VPVDRIFLYDAHFPPENDQCCHPHAVTWDLFDVDVFVVGKLLYRGFLAVRGQIDVLLAKLKPWRGNNGATRFLLGGSGSGSVDSRGEGSGEAASRARRRREVGRRGIKFINKYMQVLR